MTAALSRAGAPQFGGGLLAGGQNQITPEQASQIPPEAVHEIAREILKTPPEVGYLTISNALQWRLQYSRVIEKAGQVNGVSRIK